MKQSKNKIEKIFDSYQEDVDSKLEEKLLERVMLEHGKVQISGLNKFFTFLDPMKSLFMKPQAKVIALAVTLVMVPLFAVFIYSQNFNSANPAQVFSARVNALKGDLTVKNTESTKTVAVGDEIKETETLVTDSEGFADISFSNGSKVSLAPDTIVEFDSLNKDKVTVENKSGEVYVSVAPSGTLFEVSVDDTTYRARGTEFKVINRNEVTSLIVYESEVEVIKPETDTVVIKKGEVFTTKPTEDGKIEAKKETVNEATIANDPLKQWSDSQPVNTSASITPTATASTTVTPTSTVSATPTQSPGTYQVLLLANNTPNDLTLSSGSNGKASFTIFADVFNASGKPDRCDLFYTTNGVRTDVYSYLTNDSTNDYSFGKGTYTFSIDCSVGSAIVKDEIVVTIVDPAQRALIVGDANSEMYNRITSNGGNLQMTQTLAYGTTANVPIEVNVNKVYSCSFGIYFDKSGTKIYLETKTITQPQYTTSFTNSQGDGTYYVTSECERQDGTFSYQSAQTRITTQPQNLDAGLIGTTHSIYLSSYNSVNPQAQFRGSIKVTNILTNVFINMKVVGDGTGFRPGQEYQMYVCYTDAYTAGGCSSHTGAKSVAGADGSLHFDTSDITIAIHSGRWPQTARIYENYPAGPIPALNCMNGNNSQACAAGAAYIRR